MVKALIRHNETLEMVKTEVFSQRQLLNKLLTKPGSPEDGDLPDDVKFPLQTIEDLEELDILLRNKSLKNKLVSFFTRLLWHEYDRPMFN